MLKSALLHAALAATLCLSAPAYAETVKVERYNSDGTVTVTEEEVAPTPRTSDFVPVATLAGLLSVQLNPGAPGKTNMIYVKAKTP